MPSEKRGDDKKDFIVSPLTAGVTRNLFTEGNIPAALAKALIVMDRLFTTKDLNLFLKRCLSIS